MRACMATAAAPVNEPEVGRMASRMQGLVLSASRSSFSTLMLAWSKGRLVVAGGECPCAQLVGCLTSDVLLETAGDEQ